MTLDLPDGDGLKAGSTPPRVSGLEVGQLSKLNLNPGGKVTGEMTVDPSVVTLLREKTLIQMKKPKLSLDNPSISTLLTGNTFELVPGEGEPRNHFSVMPADKALLDEPTSPPLPSRRRELRHRRRSAAGAARSKSRPGAGA